MDESCEFHESVLAWRSKEDILVRLLLFLISMDRGSIVANMREPGVLPIRYSAISTLVSWIPIFKAFP